MEFNHYNSLNQSTVDRKERRRKEERVVEIGICRIKKEMQGRKGEGRKRKAGEEGITSWDKYQQGVKNKLL